MGQKCPAGCTCGRHRADKPVRPIATAGYATRTLTADGRPRRFPVPVFVHGRPLQKEG